MGNKIDSCFKLRFLLHNNYLSLLQKGMRSENTKGKLVVTGLLDGIMHMRTA